MVPTFESANKTLKFYHGIKTIEQYFPLVMFQMLYMVDLCFHFCIKSQVYLVALKVFHFLCFIDYVSNISDIFSQYQLNQEPFMTCCHKAIFE